MMYFEIFNDFLCLKEICIIVFSVQYIGQVYFLFFFDKMNLLMFGEYKRIFIIKLLFFYVDKRDKIKIMVFLYLQIILILKMYCFIKQYIIKYSNSKINVYMLIVYFF